MFTERDQEYLRKKHLGAVSNEKGSLFEIYYAIYRIALLLRQFNDNRLTSFTSQVEMAFVDDLLILYENGLSEFYQIKNVKGLTWETGNPHSIKYDFQKQMELLISQKLQFKLFLVYSDTDSSVVRVPPSISDCTETRFFPFRESLSRLLLESPEFRNAIQDISAEASPELDKLHHLATILLGLWQSFDKQNVTLERIVTHIRHFTQIEHNFIFDDEIVVNKKASKLYDQIPYFRYSVEGAIFRWEYKEYLKGELSRSRYKIFEQAVLKKRPSLFEEIELFL